MTDQELLEAVKAGLQVEGTGFDSVLLPKVLSAKAYMVGAGATTEAVESALGIDILTMAVGDRWSLEAGEVKFSPALNTMLTQLVIGSNILTVSSDPADGAVGVAITVQPVLIFNKRLDDYEVSIVEYATEDNVTVTVKLDITKKTLTVTPAINLIPATKYAVVIKSATAYSGQVLDYTVISFTTS